MPPGNYPPGPPYQGPAPYGPRGPNNQGGPGRYAPPQQDPRYRQGPRNAPNNDPDLYPRPIIKEEDLKSMDEIINDNAWAAAQDEPDYEKKLFVDDLPEEPSRKAPPSNAVPVEEEPKAERDGKWADNIQPQGRAISTPPITSGPNRDRAPQAGAHLRQPQPNNRPLSLDEDDFWREQQRQQKNVEIKAAQRAKEMRYSTNSSR